MDHVLQPLRSGSVAAVVDMHPAIGQAVRLHFQHYALQCAVLAAGLAQNLQITGVAGLPDDPDAQHPRHGSYRRFYAAVAGEGDDPALKLGAMLPTEVFREALEALDPEAVLLLDNNAADAMRETYADMLVAIDDFDTAMLKPGLVAHVQGRRVLALDGFEAALTDKAAKQRMWAYIKQLTPAAAPL